MTTARNDVFDKRIDLIRLTILAKEGQVLRAAKKLNVSQPGLSKIVASLEEQFQGQLFERIQRGVRLTPYGAYVVERAHRVLREADKAEREVKRLLGGDRASLRIGASTVWMQVIIPQVVEEFQRDFPTIEIVLSTRSYREGVEMLEDGMSDMYCGVFSDKRKLPAYLTREASTIMNFNVVADERHPIHRIRHPNLTDLSIYPWIDYEFDAYAGKNEPLPSLNKVLREIEQRTGRRARGVLRSNSLSLNLMLSGPYLAYLSSAVLLGRPDLPLKVVPVNAFSCHVEAGTISRSGLVPTPPLKHFKQILSNVAAF